MSKVTKKKEDAAPQKTQKIHYKGTDYELTFPNTGQLMDLAVMKAQLSDGNYNIISNMPALADNLAQFSIDTVTHLTVLCPELLRNLNVKTYSEMELMDMKELIKLYIKDILPWMNSWYNVLNDIDAE